MPVTERFTFGLSQHFPQHRAAHTQVLAQGSTVQLAAGGAGA